MPVVCQNCGSVFDAKKSLVCERCNHTIQEWCSMCGRDLSLTDPKPYCKQCDDILNTYTPK